nr:hypothetical protein GCM10020092_090250 [Actinoplanes digitatis]
MPSPGGVRDATDGPHPGLYGIDDGLLGDAVAVADLCRVGQLRRGGLGVRRAEVEEQPDPLLRQRGAAVERLDEVAGLADVAEQRCADQPPVPDDHALVHAATTFGEHHGLVVVPVRLLEAHRGHVDAERP